MRRIIKHTLFICLALLVCALTFTACDSGNVVQTTDETTEGAIELETHIHTFGKWTIVKQATCTANGEQECTCACGEKETQSIAMIAHTEVIDEAVAATCTATGLTEGKHCSVCNEVLAAQQEVVVVAHTYDDKYDETCNVCGFVRDAECAHLETEVIKGKAATCTSTGLTDGTKCKKCGEILVAQSEISAKGHTEVTDKEVTPTCTATGLTEGKHCSVCNTVLTKQEVVKTKAHTEVIDKAVAATCTTAGLTEGKHCSVCDKVLVAQTTIDARGHAESDWIIDSSATCEVAGERHKYCSTCGLNYDNENYRENHDMSHRLTTSYCYYSGDQKLTWSQDYPFVADVCKNCNYGFWCGPVMTLKRISTSFVFDGIHYNFKAIASDHAVSELKFRYIIADFPTVIKAEADYKSFGIIPKFDYDSGWIDDAQYEFDCLNFNPTASYDNPFLFVVAYDPVSGTKQSYMAHIDKVNGKTDGTWYYATMDLSFGETP